MYFCYVNLKRKESAKYHCFSNFSENFHSRNNALWDLSKVCQLQEQKISEASDLYRFQKSPKKNTSKISRKSTENRMTKEWAFIESDLKSAKSTIFGRWVPKNGILSSTNSTVFRRCLKEYALSPAHPTDKQN